VDKPNLVNPANPVNRVKNILRALRVLRGESFLGVKFLRNLWILVLCGFVFSV
jgi:hypothetical protein